MQDERDRSLAPSPQDSFVVARHASYVLAEFWRRCGANASNAEYIFAAYVGLVATRNKQIAAECLTTIEDAILSLDDEPIANSS